MCPFSTAMVLLPVLTMSTTRGSFGFGSASSCLTAINTLLRSRAGPQLPCKHADREWSVSMGASLLLLRLHQAILLFKMPCKPYAGWSSWYQASHALHGVQLPCTLHALQCVELVWCCYNFCKTVNGTCRCCKAPKRHVSKPAGFCVSCLADVPAHLGWHVEHIQADASLSIYVGMVHCCLELHLWGLKGIPV